MSIDGNKQAGRVEAAEATVQNRTDASHEFQLKEFQPAAARVSGEKLMAVLVKTLQKYVVLPILGAVAVALWIIRAHAHDCFDVNPRIAFLSPEKRCGKTTILELLAHLTPRALLASNVTPATVFRIIEATRPTLLLDEMDSFHDAHEELRGILNSGHRRAGAFVLRCTGDDHQPKPYSTWCPMAFAAIGKLPGTLEDRSIVIHMRRRSPNEKIGRLRWTGRQGEALRTSLMAMGEAIARWVMDHADALRQQDSAIPEQLHDRAADNWASLLAIADTIGGEWPEKTRAAAIVLSGSYDSDNDSFGVQLLNDVRTVFSTCDLNSLSSKNVCGKLAAMEERSWGSWRHGRRLSPVQLSRLLRPFGIHSRDMWDKEKERSYKGYAIEDFGDAFDRYLPSVSSPSPEPGVSKREGARTRSSTGDQVDCQSAMNTHRASQSATISAPVKASRVLAVQKGGISKKAQDGVSRAHLDEFSKVWRRVKPIKQMH
jgi:putative DNA primase/helicase